MESVIRAAATYAFAWLVFRIAGKRTLAQITTFDAVLLLIISETTQAALIDNDNSLTNSFVLILTMLGIDVLLSCLKQKFHGLERVLDGVPRVLMERGEFDDDSMKKERVDRDDVLHAARERHGIGSLEGVEYAVLEQSGGISIVPKEPKS